MPILPSLATLLIGFFVSIVLTVLAIRLGLKFGIVDEPGGRRRHAQVTSRLGALPLFGAFTVAALVSQVFGVKTSDSNEQTRLTGMLIGGAVVFVLAVLDDKFNLPPVAQFLGQALASLIAISHLIFIERFTNPFTGRETVLPDVLGPAAGFALVIALSLLWFMGMMNTVNFLDGVDGLAATVSLIAASVTAIHMLREGQYSVALLPIALLGALLGFLVFNFPPARIFLGGGALYLGFTLACVGIIAGAKVALLLLVMGLPIADVAWQMIDRARRGRSPTSSDRGHLHLRLADMGWSARRIIVLYAGACLLFGGAALVIQPPLLKLATLIALGLAVIFAMFRLSAAQVSKA